MLRTVRPVACVVLGCILLNACAHQNQNTYDASEVGKPTTVEFGTVIQERKIDIIQKSTGGGALLGAGSGAAAGATLGKGGGLAMLAGILVGGIVGAIAENEVKDTVGIEYTILLKNKKTIVVTQNQGADDIIFQPRAHIMVQTRGNYQRVLSAENLPDEVEKPKSVHIKKKALPAHLEPDEDDKEDMKAVAQ